MFTIGEIILWSLIAVPFVLLLLAAALGAHEHAKSIKIAATSACPTCGKPVGLKAVRAALKREAQKAEEMRRQHPNVRFTMVAEWDIRCPNCSAVFYFYPLSNTIATDSMFRKTALQSGEDPEPSVSDQA